MAADPNAPLPTTATPGATTPYAVGGGIGGYTTPGPSSSTGAGGGWLSSFNNFLSSPTGQLVSAAVPAAVGLYSAGSASSQGKKLAGSITATGQPGQNVSNATYGQLTGKGTVGGPYGQGIAGATGAANQLAQTAQQYASGNLTPAQQLQVQQQAQGQTAQLYGSMGNNLNSSAALVQEQQIQNNAAMLTEQLRQGNIQLAQNALQSVTSTYSSLLSNALNQAQLGETATQAGVTQAIQSNTQISNYIQQLLSQIAQGLSGASGGGGQAGGGGGAQSTIGGQLASAAKNFFTGGGGGVAYQGAGSQENLSGVANIAQQAQAADVGLQAGVQNWQPSAAATDYTAGISDFSANIDTSGLGGYG